MDTVQLRVLVSHGHSPEAAAAGRKQGAVCAVVGGSPALGNWDPKAAPALQLAAQQPHEGFTAFEGSLAAGLVPVGTEYKYCILHRGSHTYAWDQKGPMQKMPAASLATHCFEGAAPPDGAGAAAAPLAPTAAPVAVPAAPSAPAGRKPAAEPEEVDASAEHSDCWIPWQADAPAGQGHRAPRTIYHAFHRSFADVAKMVPELRQMGFDSVQISPAQKSKDGHEWWARYQPKDYDVIEGYGTVEALSQLCRCAREHSMIVIADVVFNHMLVVASANEWEQAQRDESRLRALQLRLEKEVGPTFSAADFQWPWFKLYGHHWDNLSRYEGWGNGEWSELRHCSKVVSVHNRHLQILLDAGVRGFRFDAVKHMRVEHIAEYVKYLSEHGDPWCYGEVLSVDAAMHEEYSPLQTTDFPLAVYLSAALRGGPEVATAGASAAAAKAAGLEGLQLQQRRRGAEAAGGGARGCALSASSVRFARNHDTVQNPGSFYGLSQSCSQAKAVWAWLLAVHDGTVLVYPDDLEDRGSGALLRRALAFRARCGAAGAAQSEVCLRYGKGGGPPRLLSVALRCSGGRLVGLCLLSLLPKSRLRIAAAPWAPRPGEAATWPLLAEDGTAALLRAADGALLGAAGAASTVVLQPLDAAFFYASAATSGT